MNCDCSSEALFSFGCLCGAFIFEQNNHVWFNGLDYIIAKNPIEASQLLSIYLGRDVASSWKLHPDEELLTVLETTEEVTLTAKNWVLRYGPGFLANLELEVDSENS